jgi:hypothetical protein
MKIQLKSFEQSAAVVLELPDERQTLQNFLSLLDASNIAEIEISDYKENKYPRALGRFSALKTLRFVRCHALTDIGSEIAKCPNLLELAFIRCADLYHLRGIQNCKNLKVLHLSACESLDTLPDELQGMTTLKALDLSYSTNIQWLDLDILPPNLRLLDIHGCWRIDFDDAKAAQLPLVSVQIQDASRFDDLDTEPRLDHLVMHLRHTLTMRDGCGLDAD